MGDKSCDDGLGFFNRAVAEADFQNDLPPCVANADESENFLPEDSLSGDDWFDQYICRSIYLDSQAEKSDEEGYQREPFTERLPIQGLANVAAGSSISRESFDRVTLPVSVPDVYRPSLGQVEQVMSINDSFNVGFRPIQERQRTIELNPWSERRFTFSVFDGNVVGLQVSPSLLIVSCPSLFEDQHTYSLLASLQAMEVPYWLIGDGTTRLKMFNIRDILRQVTGFRYQGHPLTVVVLGDSFPGRNGKKHTMNLRFKREGGKKAAATFGTVLHQASRVYLQEKVAEENGYTNFSTSMIDWFFACSSERSHLPEIIIDDIKELMPKSRLISRVNKSHFVEAISIAASQGRTDLKDLTKPQLDILLEYYLLNSSPLRSPVQADKAGMKRELDASLTALSQELMTKGISTSMLDVWKAQGRKETELVNAAGLLQTLGGETFLNPRQRSQLWHICSVLDWTLQS